MGRSRCKIPIKNHDTEATPKITNYMSESGHNTSYETVAQIKQPLNNNMTDLMKHDYLTKSIEKRITRKVLKDAYLQNARLLKHNTIINRSSSETP